MATYRIPLSEGAQSFSIELGGTLYNMKFIYRESLNGGSWFMDMEKADGSDAIYGIPLVLGVDLLEQFQYKGFGHLIVEMDGGIKRRPAYEDLGRSVFLYWSD